MNPIDTLNAQLVRVRNRVDALMATDQHDERGNVTLEQVLWAVIIVALVGVVGGALTSFVNNALSVLR